MYNSTNMVLRSRNLRKRKSSISSQTNKFGASQTITNFSSKSIKLNEKTQIKFEILDLPEEILSKIASFLDAKAIGNLSASCHTFNYIVNENLFWKYLFKNKFLHWNKHPTNFLHKGNWKRQYAVNHTKSIQYQMIGSGAAKRAASLISEVSTAYGIKKICCSRDHVFALDMASSLHVFKSKFNRFEAVTAEQTFEKVEWHKEFARYVVDVTTDPRSDNHYRRYVYVLTQSESMRKRLQSQALTGLDGNKLVDIPFSGDKIDVFDERTCRRVFNMTFDPEMRFISMRLATITSHQKTLYILTDSGKVYTLKLMEASLLNLGSEGMQVTLKSVSKHIGEKICKIESSVGIASLITQSGRLFVTVHKTKEFTDLFGRDAVPKVLLPKQIPHIVVSCAVGERHIGFIDEYNRVFLVGSNRYGQLGTGDREDRHTPVQVLNNSKVRIIYCGLNHSLAIIEQKNGCCEVWGSGSGNYGRLPGQPRGCLEFKKLKIKVPWSVRQIVAHKESIFFLNCFDPIDQMVYKTRESTADYYSEWLSLKTQQELLIELRKTTVLAQKMKIIDAMMANVKKEFEGSDKKTTELPTQLSAISGDQGKSSKVKKVEHLSSFKLLMDALSLVKMGVERLELDHKILLESITSK